MTAFEVSFLFDTDIAGNARTTLQTSDGDGRYADYIYSVFL